jgi:DNA-binding NarL/FixJ family response regulator
VVLLSIRLPNRRAVDVARRIARRRRATRFVYLDDAARPAALDAALKGPVHGYWSKQSGFTGLLDCLDRVADGRWAFDPAVEGCLEWSNEGPRLRYWPVGTALAKLSAREREVLAVLAEGVSVKQCALRFDLAPNTIDNHKSRIMNKVGLRKNTELLWLAIREGLVEV